MFGFPTTVIGFFVFYMTRFSYLWWFANSISVFLSWLHSTISLIVSIGTIQEVFFVANIFGWNTNSGSWRFIWGVLTTTETICAWARLLGFIAPVAAVIVTVAFPELINAARTVRAAYPMLWTIRTSSSFRVVFIAAVLTVLIAIAYVLNEDTVAISTFPLR